MKLEEYAKLHPAEDNPADRQVMIDAANDYKTRQQALAEAESLKASIMQQLEQGNAPQYILYTALKAIGLLSGDMEWTEAGSRRLDAVYADLAQESFITDNAAIAAARLKTMNEEYKEKTRRQLQRSINGYRKLNDALQEALNLVNDLDPAEKDAGEE